MSVLVKTVIQRYMHSNSVNISKVNKYQSYKCIPIVIYKTFSTKKHYTNKDISKHSNEKNNNINDKKHIQIHTYRSVITLSKDEVNPNELDLSLTERLAHNHQTKASKKIDKESFAPVIAYEIWNSPPEVYDRIYGFETDCEPPDRHNISWNWLYKLWGYYSEKEIRYRCSLYTYMKAQRRCQNETFWNVFNLENTFRVELQLLCLHLWIAKTRILLFEFKKSQKLSYKTFKLFFDQLPNRFTKNRHGVRSGWVKDCQQACIHLAISLDNAYDDYINHNDTQSIGKVIWNEIYLSDTDVEHDVLYLWTKYILDNIKYLKYDVNDNCFLNGWWKYIDIPNENDKNNIRNEIINQYNINGDTNIFDNLKGYLDKK